VALAQGETAAQAFLGLMAIWCSAQGAFKMILGQGVKGVPQVKAAQPQVSFDVVRLYS
jgi:hypothetical protein